MRIFFIHSRPAKSRAERGENRPPLFLWRTDEQWPLTSVPSTQVSSTSVRGSIPPKEPWASARVGFILFIIMWIANISMAQPEESFKYNANGKRDPFMPLISGGGYTSDAYEVRAIEDIRLEGIVCDETKDPIAIINGEIVKEGQKIGSVKVLKIEKDGVIFNIGEDIVKVKLEKDK